MSFRFDRQLKPTDALVVLLPLSSFDDEKVLEDALRCAACEYGFRFEVQRDAGATVNGSDYDVSLAIIRWKGSFDPSVIAHAAGMLSTFSTVSIAFTYSDIVEMNSCAAEIDTLKCRFSDRLNFLRPDSTNGKNLSVSVSKIVSNAICDSVRIKYKPQRADGDFDWDCLSLKERQYFLDASEVYEEYRLFHRSPGDGYFAIRHKAGFVVTATKTAKFPFDRTRLTYVQSFAPETRSLVYSGTFLPSSDSVEAAIIFQRLPHVEALIHTHASGRFLRNPEYAWRVTVPSLPYGEAALGFATADALAKSDGFVIIEDHGEVFADLGKGAPSLISSLCRHCQESTSDLQMSNFPRP